MRLLREAKPVLRTSSTILALSPLLLAFCLFAVPASAAPAAQPPADAPHALVVRIVDGDTIDVEIGGYRRTVRYIGIDTPERGQPLWSEATEANRALVEGATVALASDVSETDRHGRMLRYVYLVDGSGTFVNAELVHQGFARVLTVPPDVAHAEEFLRLERGARPAERGLWGVYRFPVYLPSLNHLGCVDLNRASLEDLMLLDGIGGALALRIMEMRPYPTIDDLARVRGIGPGTIEKIREQGLGCVRGGSAASS